MCFLDILMQDAGEDPLQDIDVLQLGTEVTVSAMQTVLSVVRSEHFIGYSVGAICLVGMFLVRWLDIGLLFC
jgi:hypothetical protein